MNKVKYPILEIALILVIILNISGCRNTTDRIVIPVDANGYHLSELIGIEQNTLLSALSDAEADPLFYNETFYLGANVRTYVLIEEQYGLEFQESLFFINYPDSKKHIFSGYYKTLQLDHWPDEFEQKSIQSLFNNMINEFGNPWQKDYIFNSENVLFDEYKTSKNAEWEDGLIRFTIDYDLITKTTEIIISNYNSQFYNDNYEDFHGGKRLYIKESPLQTE